MRRRLCAAILSLQAIVLGLTTPVLITVNKTDPWIAVLIGVGLLVACVLAAGMLRREWAYWLGWLIQVASIALGVVISTMIVLGVVFMVLWATAYFLGRRIDHDRAQWEAAAAAAGGAD